jgi:hypothetical protein
MCLIADNVSTFQTIKFGITTLMRTKQMPYFIKIHCMAHKTNLVIQSLSIMIFKLEDILQALYSYLSTSPK